MYRGLISLMPKAQPLLLDLYPNAAVAYSLRKLRTAYTGSAIRVRRFVDNTEQDFGFDTNGDLDIAGIESFFGNNLLLQSENFNTTWGKANTSVSTGVIVGPNGVDMADKLQESIPGTATHTLTQSSGTVTNGKDYFFSIYLKAGERNVIDFVSSITGVSLFTRLNLTTGTIVSNGFTNTPTLTDVGDGWWKFELVITSGVSSIPTGFQIMLTNGTTQTYAGTVGFGCYIWGAQISGGSSVVPYFKTTTVIAANAFVTTWYDQSVNGNNATQATAASQAQIIANGHKILDPNTNKISTLWTGDAYNLTNTITTVQLMYHYMVFNRTSNANSSAGLSKSNTTFPTMLRWFATTGNITSYLNASIIHSTNTTTGSNLITTLRDSSNVVKMFRNNVALTTGVSSNIGATFDNWGNANASRNTGNFAELVHWNSDQEANRTGIETNVNTYWNAY